MARGCLYHILSVHPSHIGWTSTQATVGDRWKTHHARREFTIKQERSEKQQLRIIRMEKLKVLQEKHSQRKGYGASVEGEAFSSRETKEIWGHLNLKKEKDG